MPNSATVRNAMADVVKRRQQREDILDRSSEIYNLDGDECDEEADSLCHLDDLFVSDSGIRIFKAFTPLSKDEFEAIWDKVGVKVIVDRSSDRGPCCKTTPKDAFLLYCLFAIYLQMGQSWGFIWNDSANSTEGLL